jgi:hypothetical protein
MLHLFTRLKNVEMNGCTRGYYLYYAQRKRARMQLTISVLFLFFKKIIKKRKRRPTISFFFFTWKQSKKQTNISLSFYLYFRRWRDCRQTINQVDVMTV